jgi:hypothetical protein
MAISTTDIGTANTSGKIGYNLWGTVWNPSSIRRYSDLFLTCNRSVPYSANGLKGLTASFSHSPSSLSWGVGVLGAKSIIITANVAWTYSYTNPDGIFGGFYIESNVSFDSSTGGGNGNITIIRYTSDPGFGSVTIWYCNGAGGKSSVTVNLSGF